MNTTEPIGVGLIGCGTVAQYGHLPTMVETAGLKLIAVADTFPETAEKIGTQYGVPAFTDYHELLARQDIAAVTVSTPLQYHYEVAAAALRAGKHVFCEKPLADSPEHCKHLVELAREHGRMFAMNFEYRFDAGVLKMRELVLSGELGAVQVLRFINNWSAHGIQGEAGKRRARFMQDGGGSLDCGIHYVDLARFLSGSEFQSISAYGQWAEPEFRGPGHMIVQSRMANGALALLESSFIYTHSSKTKLIFMQVELIGERGVVAWCTPPRTPGGSFEVQQDELHIVTDERTEVIPFSTDKQFATTYDEWTQCLRQGSLAGSRLATVEDGSAATCFMWESLAMAERERAAH